jgi:hypothetical protein
VEFDEFHFVDLWMVDGYCFAMSAVEVMELVKQLPAEEAVDLGRMVDDWTAGLVDKKFEEAINAGAFDKLAAEALREFEAGKTLPLNEVLDQRQLP